MSTISASTTSTTAYKVTADTTGTLVLQTGSTPTTAVTIDTSQRVGIGTSSPTTTLTLSQATARLKAISTGDNGSWSEWASNNGSGNVFYSGMDNSTGTSFGVPYAGVMYHGGAYPLVFANSGTERGRFDTSGRFLVGLNTAVTSWGSGAAQQIQATASGASYPGYSAYAFSASAGSAGMINLGHSRSATVGTLSTTQSGDVLGYLVFEGVNSSNALAGGGYISITQTGAAGATYIPGALQFYTSDASAGAAERARITSSGGLWVGTSTRQSTSNHAFIQNTVNDWTANFQCNTGTSSQNLGVLIYYAGSSPNNTSAQFLLCQDPGGTRAEFRSNGGLANYSANNANLSDVRTKTDIQDAGSYLSKICAIPVRTFKYKDQTDDLLNLGVIAQEVEAVAPELVDVSGFGETPEDGVPLKAIYQTDLQYALMKCIQEQQALIETLTNRITALEAK